VSESRAIVDPEEILSYWFPQSTMPIQTLHQQVVRGPGIREHPLWAAR
jgi:hypothetical protein